MADEDRFNRFEYPSGDFPYYNGLPVGISGREWLFILGMVLLGFLALVAPVPLSRAGSDSSFRPSCSLRFHWQAWPSSRRGTGPRCSGGSAGGTSSGWWVRNSQHLGEPGLRVPRAPAIRYHAKSPGRRPCGPLGVGRGPDISEDDSTALRRGSPDDPALPGSLVRVLRADGVLAEKLHRLGMAYFGGLFQRRPFADLWLEFHTMLRDYWNRTAHADAPLHQDEKHPGVHWRPYLHGLELFRIQPPDSEPASGLTVRRIFAGSCSRPRFAMTATVIAVSRPTRPCCRPEPAALRLLARAADGRRCA